MSSINRSESISRLDQVKVSAYFGCDTFGWRTMQERLPKEVFRALRKCIRKGERLSAEVAHVVAQAMKDWAIERGATHFTHWFQPMTGATAEKHDAFITWDDHGGLIESFSGAQLIQGEPDASSFPSGGLRTTFEARGYTAWDPVSPAFLMNGPLGKTLCIPTAFIGYHGEALDHKVPLLRAMDFVGQQASQTLALFGHSGAVVTAQCGAEQEYFLVDLELYKARPDLMFCNRTLQGARPPKGQELEDHYFGAIKERVLRFMQDLELELFRLGIPAKTRHNEVAPNQFELAPIYEPANVAADHNQLLMEVMKKVGERHELAVLLGEKPFAGVNGSGKHVNFSLGADDGQNLFDPGHSPEENLQFLYFLSSVLLGVFRHGAVLRASVASASNDHRLGANEAPPAIMSVFLGEQLNRILDQLESGAVLASSERLQLDLGIPALPVLAKDYTDRNRTSPMAFTGNKFEFRAVGSGQAIAVPLKVIQTLVGDSLSWMNQRVRELEGKQIDRRQALMEVIREVVTLTKAVRFDGNGYSAQWREEAERRGLPHAKNTVEALAAWEQPKTQELFVRAGVMSTLEQEARIHVRHEQYAKSLLIEAQVLRELAETQILPVLLEDLGNKAKCLSRLQAVGPATQMPTLQESLTTLSGQVDLAYARVAALRGAITRADAVEDLHGRTLAFATEVLPACQALREVLDSLEDQCDARLWPLPKYRELLAPLG
ncbi:MAG: glutamine synthetase III [Deltaproteobacteria bacterium]|jgi:glutamine synthetase|nr:glutamine synthetase III [Deltaproteobacteria bacterium]